MTDVGICRLCGQSYLICTHELWERMRDAARWPVPCQSHDLTRRAVRRG